MVSAVGLAREQHHLDFAGLCSRPAPKQQFGFLFPPNEHGGARAQRFEAALDGPRLQRRSDTRRLMLSIAETYESLGRLVAFFITLVPPFLE
jgi:hypothetical protein